MFEPGLISELVRLPAPPSNLASEGGLEFSVFYAMDTHADLICRFVGWLILDKSTARG